MQCPVYKSNNCILKSVFTSKFNSVLFSLPLEQISAKYEVNCQGELDKCCFVKTTTVEEEKLEVVVHKKEEKLPEPEPEPEPVQEVKEEPENQIKVSLHQVSNPYLVKSDVLVYPANIILNLDDDVINSMSKNIIQNELDNIRRPIKMGSVYVTSNGGEKSQVKPTKIFHAVVSGESRLVNEIDIKSATRKSLMLANDMSARNVVVIPCDCGTHDIYDTARVQLSAIKTYIDTEKNLKIKNIFVVMEDKESLEVYEEYYNRIFVQWRTCHEH